MKILRAIVIEVKQISLQKFFAINLRGYALAWISMCFTIMLTVILPILVSGSFRLLMLTWFQPWTMFQLHRKNYDFKQLCTTFALKDKTYSYRFYSKPHRI